ncbi:uncharacterized protein PADG_12532 [Paracoccidioides brasiliensis Pb18]|uniref:Uncharacterized protein n=1 Tax=Paracoccidioides brasiliensis (strain Pb18) TaxID=502780 RepID=A0A0A0HVD8_PARBD|nr:uncharacterized protein PADG_12532 [Paracoccidioides brasiliensis Pb18]KGM91395.1 hypothetical protein PADG_12532 [Paracoccidioides brasiliensis Pb18]
MAYCIAFSIDGATDVTRRYVRNPAKHGISRTRAPEEVLLWVIHEIRRMRRDNLSKAERRRLMKEDEREERELRGYMAQAIATEINNLFPNEQLNTNTSINGNSASSDETKIPVASRNGTVEWSNINTTNHDDERPRLLTNPPSLSLLKQPFEFTDTPPTQYLKEDNGVLFTSSFSSSKVMGVLYINPDALRLSCAYRFITARCIDTSTTTPHLTFIFPN